MIPERLQEFIALLLIENSCFNDLKFSDYIKDNYNTKKFNNRYKELLDDFLNEYALNKTEKSEENL